ncbi:MAG: acyl-CoA dehydrogenase, partial [Candidatus Zixiibacteriota bacterium]
MDFQLTEEALEFKEMAKEFAEKRLYPNALEIDEKSEMPDEIIKECAELGYFGFTVPEEYGGLGLSATSFMGVIEEFSAACAGFTILLSVEGSLIVDILMKYGTEEQKQKYLPGIASGEAFGAYCLTEPDAGTDAGALKTIAEDKGDHYLMNGTKSFISHAHLSKLFIVFAKTDPEKGS